MEPVQVDANPPAKKPYERVKRIRTGEETEKPHRKKTERVEPTAEIRVTLCGAKRSLSDPNKIWPKTDVKLSNERVRVEIKLLMPMDNA